MESVESRFMRYVRIDTQSKVDADQIPSTKGQFELAQLLAHELRALGVTDAHVSRSCYVYGHLPSNLPEGASAPALGLIAHMDTATESSGAGVKPRLVANYDGGPIVLDERAGIVTDPATFTILKSYVGDDLIVTDGSTLLGADDKAGVAEIMCAVAYLQEHPEIPHGPLSIAFTPDEEVGRGPELFDLEEFAADVAYTIDGGTLGEIEYENFNAAMATVTFKGTVVHPGSAKGLMVNAALVALKYASLLPQADTPAKTEGYEGFFHLMSVEGDVSAARLTYLVRDHDDDRFERRKRLLAHAAALVEDEVGEGVVTLQVTDTYRNMRTVIEQHFELIERAGAAMRALGVTPHVVPIRGGTDGAQLSFMGLPCPNLCSGAELFHGPHEFCSVQTLRTIVDMLVLLVQKFVTDAA